MILKRLKNLYALSSFRLDYKNNGNIDLVKDIVPRKKPAKIINPSQFDDIPTEK